jgi:hypothetical protein
VRAADNAHTLKSFLNEYRRTGETETLTAVEEVRIPEYQRQQHTYLIGATRYGKSELTKSLIHSYAQRDMAAVVLIDPAGDLAQQVAKFPEIGKRLVYIHPRLSKYHTPTINPLETTASKQDKQVIAQQILEAFTEVIAGGLGSAVSLPMRALLMPCILTLMDRPGSTFLDLQRFMRDAPDLISFGERSRYPVVSSFFREEFKDKRFTITKGSISTKLQELFNSGYFVDLTCGPSTIDLGAEIRKKKIIIFNLSKSSIGTLESQAYGRLVVSLILSIALRGNRTHTHLMIDECHNFVTPSIRTILLEAGKFNLSYGQSWCTESGGGFVLGILNGLAVTKLDAFDQLPEAVGAVELAPVALGRFGELENHGQRGVA